MDVVAVGDVALIRHAGDDAEAALQALGELVGGGLERGTVDGVVDILGGLPLVALVVHALHDRHGERRAMLVGVARARHVLHTLIQAGITQADGGIPAKEQFVDLLALIQACQGAILPQDRGGVGQGAQQALVAATQGAMAQLQALIEDLPELVHVALGGESHIRQVDGHNALIETTIVLGFAGLVILGAGNIVIAVTRAIGREEAAAAHAGVAIAVALGLALGELELAHLLLGDVIGHHALGGALGRELGQVKVLGALVDVILLEDVDELGERGGDPHARLVLHALVALAQGLLDDHGKIALLGLAAGLIEVHEHRHEGCLAVGGHEGDDLILDGLNATANLVAQAGLHDLGDLLLGRLDPELLELGIDLAADLLTAHLDERGEMRE